MEKANEVRCPECGVMDSEPHHTHNGIHGIHSGISEVFANQRVASIAAATAVCDETVFSPPSCAEEAHERTLQRFFDLLVIELEKTRRNGYSTTREAWIRFVKNSAAGIVERMRMEGVEEVAP